MKNMHMAGKNTDEEEEAEALKRIAQEQEALIEAGYRELDAWATEQKLLEKVERRYVGQIKN